MTKLLFVCRGNICRSPMAEFIMKDMVRRIGREESFVIASAATSSEELGNPVYAPARRKLAEQGISCEGKTARRITREDYSDFDLIFTMDEANMYGLLRAFGGDPEGKLHNLLDFAGRIGQEIDDPWFTDDFDTAFDDIQAGCMGVLNALSGSSPVLLDLSACVTRKELWQEFSDKMLWSGEYGHNLDALYDILTGMPHFGRSFTLKLPRDAELLEYARLIPNIFQEAGAECTVLEE